MLVAFEEAKDANVLKVFGNLSVPLRRTPVERAGVEVEVEFVNIAPADLV